MVNVDCPGCGASYSVAEKRIPEGGLRMRCPKCSESFMVEKPGEAAEPKRAAVPTRQGHVAPAGPLGARREPAPRTVASAGAPSPPAQKKPLFSRQARTVDAGLGAPETDDVDAGFGGPATDEADAGFGEIDAGFGVIDLSLPEAPRAARPAAAHDDLPLPRVTDDDLPMAQVTDRDLPVAASREIDLPMAVPDLPSRRVQTAPDLHRIPHDELPLPSVDEDLPIAAEADLPAAAVQADLPIPAPAADLPSLAGGADLPTARGPADLPAARGHVDLPSAREGADLPIARGAADLPTPQQRVDLPTAQGRADLPSARRGYEQDLPLAAHDNLPTTAAGLPIPADQDLPLPSPSGDLPLPADFNYPTRIGTSADDEIPLSDPAAISMPPMGSWSSVPPVEPRQEAEFLSQGTFPSDAPDSIPDLESVPARPSGAIPSPTPERGVGGELDVEQASLGELRDEAPVSELARDAAPKVRIRPSRSRALRITLAIVPAIAIAAGVVPYALGYGPYGYHLVSDSLNREEHERALATFRDSARQQLEADTAAEARTALEQARAQQARMPRFEPMAAYAAYLAYFSALRFGEAPAKAAGAQLLASVPPDAQGDEIELARAAAAAADGRLDEARAKLDGLLARRPDDVDALVLAGYVALAKSDAKAAKPLFEKAVAAGKSARTLHGLARSAQLAGKPQDAEKHAQEVLGLSKAHAGARVLLATILWHRNPKNERAVKLLDEVLTPGAPRQAASKSELVKAYALLGTIHVSQSHYGAADKAFAEALQLDPQSELALVGSGELFYTAGRFQEALGRFEAAHRANAASLHAAVGMAKTKLALERPKEATEELKALAAKQPHPLVSYWLGRGQEALANRDAAEAAYRAGMKTDDPEMEGVVDCYVGLAALLASLGRADEAETVLQQASDKLPDNAELQHARGEVALEAGRFEEAKHHFRRAIELDEKSLKARFSLGVTHRRAREHAAAARVFDEVAKADADYPGLSLERGLLHEQMGERDKALAMYNAALQKAPDDVDLKLRVASTQVLSGQPKEALPLLRDVFKERPRSAEVNHLLGRALFESGDSPQEALRFLEMAVQLDPNRAVYHLFVGIAAVEAGRTEQAEEAAEKALALDKSSAQAYWLRAVVKQKRGQSRDALEDLQLALEKNPSLSQAYATMAMCYTDQTNAAAAEDAWRKAIAGNDSMPDWHYRLGKILWDRGARDEAATHLKKAVELAANRKQPQGWLWNAHFLLGEALRTSDPQRALVAYREFLRLTAADNAYRPDALRAVEQLEGKAPPPEE